MVLKGMREKFFGKVSAVWDMDSITTGRMEIDESIGAGLRSRIKYRTKTLLGGKVDCGDVPEETIKRGIKSERQNEMYTILLPRNKGSRGWKLFYDLPLVRMKQLEQKVLELSYELSLKIEEGVGIKSPAQFQELLWSVRDLIEEFRTTEIKPVAPITPPME